MGTKTVWRGALEKGGSLAFHNDNTETFRQTACDQCPRSSRSDGDIQQEL